MITLTLDLAGKTGYAIQHEDGQIKAGVCNLTRGNLGGARSPIPMLRLWERLNRFSACYQIQRVIFEETFGRGAAKYRLDSLQHIVILWCCQNGYPWQRVSPPRWKKVTLGRPTISKQDYHQAAIRNFPDQRVFCDDIAAALWLLEYASLVDDLKRN